MAVSSENGAKLLTVIFLSSLMISLGIAAATDALIDNDRTTLHEKDTVNDVILHVSQLNEPGFQEGSVFTDTTLSAGGRHTCVILDNGSVSCWGLGVNGQLGGATSDRTTPTLTSSLGPGRTAVALSSGTHHTCAILDNGSVSCWGDGYYGQLGNGGTSDKYTPTLTSSLGTGRTAVALSSGGYHTCAILDNGDVSCWGWGYYGQLGNGGTSQQKTRPRSRAALVRVAQPWRFLLDTPTPAPSLTTGVFHAGDAHTTANWVMVKHPTKARPPSRAASA